MSLLLKSITFILLSSFLSACSVDDPASNEIISDGKSYVISGEVTAQVGEGLVLKLSDDNEITLNSGGSFEFPKSVLSGSAFEVTIAKQPTDPLQACRMTSAFKGIMPRSDLSSIKIVCEFQWTTPENFGDNINRALDNSVNSNPAKYEVAMNAGGDVIIAWQENTGSENRIYFSEFRDGKWSHPDSIDDAISIVGSDAFAPKVAINDSGLALITWYQIDNNTQRSYLLRSEYLEGFWEHPESLDESFSFPPQIDQAENLNPEVVINKNGKGIILWSQNNGNHIHVFKSELQDNRVWVHPEDVKDHISVDGNNASAYKVAIGDNDDVVIVWMQSDGTGSEGSTQQIFVSEFRGEGWIHPKSLEDNVSFGSTRAFSPTVAMNNNGHTVIAWVQSDEDQQNHIYKRQYWIERTTEETKEKDPQNLGFFWRWYEHETLGEEERVSLPGTNSTNPVVAINSAEEAVLVWESTRGGGGLNLFLVKFSGGQWSGVESPRSSFTFNLTNTARSKSSRLPEVKFSSNGSIIVSWLQVGKGYQSLLRGMFTPAGNWLLPKDIDDSVSIGATLTRVTGQEIAVSRVITCENAQEIIQVTADRTLVSHIIRCSGLEKSINIVDADNVIELVDNNYKINQTLKCKTTESPIDIDNQNITTHILSCENEDETIFIDEQYDFIPQEADDQLEPMNTPARGKVELADNGDGVVVWVQETDSRPKLFISELRTRSKKPKYSIAGSVVGLAGSGLTLKNSVRGADNTFITTETLEISENGNFNFTIKLRETEKYSVSLEQNPTDPVQNCEIKNAEGVVAASAISTISVSCVNDIENTTVGEVAEFSGADIVGATIDAEDNIYIADRGKSRIFRYSADGTSTTLVENIVFFQGSTELMVLDDSLYFLYNTTLAGGVYKIDLTSPSFLDFSTLSPFSSFEKQEKISGITSDPEGNIYVSRVDSQVDDQGESVFVSKILPTGEVKELKFSAISDGWLTLTGDEEYIYVSEFDKISRIDRAGKKYTIMAGLDEPVGLFSKNGSIYLIDNESVHKITPFRSVVERIFDAKNLPESESMRLLLDSQNDILLLTKNKIWRIE